jgi:hypothetical protein
MQIMEIALRSNLFTARPCLVFDQHFYAIFCIWQLMRPSKDSEDEDEVYFFIPF